MDRVEISYTRSLSEHLFNIVREDLAKGIYSGPDLEHEWVINKNPLAVLIMDVDETLTDRGCTLYDGNNGDGGYFEHLLEIPRFKEHAGKINGYLNKIGSLADGDGLSFGGIVNILHKYEFTWDEHIDCCRVAAETASVSGIKKFIDEDMLNTNVKCPLNSASFLEAVNLFVERNDLINVPCIGASVLGFYTEGGRKTKCNGRYFFNFGINKKITKAEILKRFSCREELGIVSDQPVDDMHMAPINGGLALWADENIERIELNKGGAYRYPGYVSINVPESRTYLPMLTSFVKMWLWARIWTMLKNRGATIKTIGSINKLLSLGEDCLKTDSMEFETKVREFVNYSYKTVLPIVEPIFPRYSSGIDEEYAKARFSEISNRKQSINNIAELWRRDMPIVRHSRELIQKLRSI